MSEKGFVNVAYFVGDLLIDAVWLLLRIALSPVFLIAWFVVEDKPIDQYDWWPS